MHHNSLEKEVKKGLVRDEVAEIRGRAIIRHLGLKPDSDGKYKTKKGPKCPIGLYRSIFGVVLECNDHKSKDEAMLKDQYNDLLDIVSKARKQLPNKSDEIKELAALMWEEVKDGGSYEEELELLIDDLRDMGFEY